MQKAPLFSVVICTRNRAALIKRALHSLTRQTVNKSLYEIIVIDDNSDDATVKVCEMMCSKLPNIRCISTRENLGVGHARNIGFKEASGKYILFLDDDCIATRNWIEGIGYCLKENTIVSGALITPVRNFFAICHNIAQFHDFMPGQRGGTRNFISGANMGFQRSVLEELNGFHTDLKYSQDIEFILRARMKGYRVFFCPDAVVSHNPDRKTFKSIVTYSIEHAKYTIILRNRFDTLLKTPFILHSPLLILLTSPLIALTITAGIYLSNFSLLKFFWTAPIVYLLKLAWCWGAALGLRNYKTTD